MTVSTQPDRATAAQRLAAVLARIAAAAQRADRSPGAVTLVAVSKAFGAEAVRALRDAGHSDFGESKAQELACKAEEVGPGVRWHFVGRLQRNKVRDVAGTASLIHSVDRLRLAEEIAARARREGRVQPVLVQVNVAAEASKGGCALADAPALVDSVRQMEGLSCQGLMAIPPLGTDPRPLYVRLRELRDRLREEFPEVQHLSMGMSADFEVAIEEGATIVRLGEVLFGPRARSVPALSEREQ